MLENTKVFFATDLSGRSSLRYKVAANLVAQGEHCVVYLAVDQEINIQKINNLVYEFDKRIYPVVVDSFGEPLSNVYDRRITLLLLDVRDGFSGSGGYVAGYFYPNDLVHTADSNILTMLYIDTNPGFNAMDNIYSTTAHELQHLINYSIRLSKANNPFDTWIDEGLSTGAEYLFKQEQQQGRIRYFTSTNTSITDGNNFFVWGNRGDLLAEYASVYMFFQWIGLNASNGYGVYKDIINSNFSDYRAITQMARLRLRGIVSEEISDEEAWEKILGTWLAANVINEPTGYYGYKSAISDIKVFPPSSSNVNLAPGEAVYYFPTVTKPENTGSLRHLFLSKANQTAYSSLTAEQYNNLLTDKNLTAIVTYNANVAGNGAEVPFTIGTMAPTSFLQNSMNRINIQNTEQSQTEIYPECGLCHRRHAQQIEEPQPEIYPVDVTTFLTGNKW
ncbi:MAG: hypothetical protein LBD20_09530 [Spirochaetaceae bacterium]|nr:hypothetical protein [Spirochaetaceae bacterium]